MTTARLIAITKPVDGSTPEDLLAYCARVSNPTSQELAQGNSKLLRYLSDHQHWSPFEMVHLVIEITTTRDIARQILRHRSFSFQEFSQRYAEVTADPIYREARLQDAKNRQNSLLTEDEDLKRWWAEEQKAVAELTKHAYQGAIDRGIAKEVARAVLPEGMTPSRMYMAGTLRSLMHYCAVRRGNGTQLEHIGIADEVFAIIQSQFPGVF